MTGKPGGLVIRSECILTILGLERVDVDGSVR